jgi:hypothetical protein
MQVPYTTPNEVCLGEESALIKLTTTVTVALVTLASSSFAENDLVTIDVSVFVPPRCTISSPNAIVNLGEISKAGSKSLSFGFSCNTGFHFSFSSMKGGLAHASHQAVAAPFVSLVPYRLSYKIGTSKGFLIDACDSSNTLVLPGSCAGASSSDAAAIDQTININFSWNLNEQIPLAGCYQDTLQLKLAPAL